MWNASGVPCTVPPATLFSAKRSTSNSFRFEVRSHVEARRSCHPPPLPAVQPTSLNAATPLLRAKQTLPCLSLRVIFPLHDLDVSRWLSDHAAESSVNQRAPAAAGGSGGDAHRKSSIRRTGGGGSPDGGGYFGSSTATAAAAAASESVAATLSPSLPAPVLYDLVGLVQHTGGLEHGHYTSYTRDDGSGATTTAALQRAQICGSCSAHV